MSDIPAAAGPDPLPSTPAFRLDGMRALVTGASAGLGRAAAVALAQAGADTVLAARRTDPMLQTVAELQAQGLRASAVALDVTDTAAMRQAVDAHGPFQILVNNAGTNIREPFMDVTEATLDTILGLNLRAAFLVAQAVARGMVAAGQGGSIINIGSVNGHVAGENKSVYVASKFAIEGLTKAMAVELGPHGIRVNSICPTWIETPLTRALLQDPDFVARTRPLLPVGRFGQVQDVMGAVVFLASSASAMMTGSALLLDGGLTAQ